MEKIQQAIERARELRHSSRTPAATGPASPESGSVFSGVTRFPIDEPRARRELLIAADRDDPRHDVFRMLRTQVLRRLQTLGGRRLAVVSARDSEGKTFVACNLAMSLARRGHGHVVLVDADLRRPSIHRRFGIKPTNSLSDVVEGQALLGDTLCNPGYDNLYLLPQARRSNHASELISSPAMRQTIQTLQNDVSKPFLVFDCSPLLQTDEPLSLFDLVDGYLIVVQEGRTLRTELARVSELIGPSKYLGTVINNARFMEGTKYYGYN